MVEDDRKLQETVKELLDRELKERFDYLFGVDITKSEDRLRLLKNIQLILTMDLSSSDMAPSVEVFRTLGARREDLDYLSGLRKAADAKEKEIQKTWWDTLRQFISPIVLAAATAVISWIGLNRAGH